MRKRGAAFEEVIRALKGPACRWRAQDRLDVAAHIAVNDLVAVGRAGLLPADDLTLATALKTPLVGLTDDDLVRIAARRDLSETLEDALHRQRPRGRPGGVSRPRGAPGLDLGSPARRGPSASTPRCSAPTRGGPAWWRASAARRGMPSTFPGRRPGRAGQRCAIARRLPRPLCRPDRAGEAGHTVKRDLESGRNEVRVMTVHGAKGLEAPVVVVIDGCEPLGRNDPPLLPMGRPAAGTARPRCPGLVERQGPRLRCHRRARAALQARAREEHNRLLYVAMTRAADRLVIAPYRGRDRETEASWCEMIRGGLTRAFGPGEAIETPYGPITLWPEGESAHPGLTPAEAGDPPGGAARPGSGPPWPRRSRPPRP